jgi:hypothetical protein
MGRESRRAKPPKALDNEGDKARLLEGGWYGLERLQGDLRMIEQVLAWQHGRDLPRLFEQSFTIADNLALSALRPLSDAAAQEAFAIIWRPPTAAELAAIEQTLEAMGLQYLWPFGPWAARTFVTSIIPTFVHNMCLPDQYVALKVEYLGPELHKRGYIPRDKGSAKLKRDSGYWYRARIKEPKDSLRALNREYLQSVNRHDSSRSRVEECIEQFESLLRRVGVPADPADPNKTGPPPA